MFFTTKLYLGISRCVWKEVMMEEKFTLTHNQFARLAPEAFKNLFNDEYFSDITLATKDNKQIKAHPKKCCRQPKETYGED